MTADAPTRASPNLLTGTLFLIGAVAAFTGIDAVAKLLSDGYSPVQVLWARYIFFILPLLMIVRLGRWPDALRTGQLWLQIGRALLPMLSSLAIIIGLASLPLADATAILFAAPLMITVLSIPLLGERVGVVRWVAVACGFVGVVIVARPGSGVIGWAALWPLIGALFLALFHIATRLLSGAAHALTTLAYTALVGTLATTAAVPFFWTPPTASAWGLFIASGLLFGLGHFLIIKALDYAEASALAPFNYSQIIVATGLGVLVFGEFPDVIALFGMFVIVGAGLFVFVRQKRNQPG